MLDCKKRGLAGSSYSRIRDTPYPWLTACEATMEPDAFVQGKCFCERTMISRAPAADVSTCRSKSADGVEVERVCDYVVACKGLRSNVRKVKVIEDYDSRPLMPVGFEVRCKERAAGSEDLESPEAAARCQWRENIFGGGQCGRC